MTNYLYWLNEPVHQGPIHPLLPQATQFVSQGRMCGYIVQFLCFCSTQTHPICYLPHIPQPHICSQAVRESFIVYLKLFPNFWNSWVKYSLITNVSQQTIVKIPVCMQIQGFFLSLYQRSDLGYLLLLLGYSSLLDSPDGFQVWGITGRLCITDLTRTLFPFQPLVTKNGRPIPSFFLLFYPVYLQSLRSTPKMPASIPLYTEILLF